MANTSWDVVLFGDTGQSFYTRPMGMYSIANHLRELGYKVKCVWMWNHVDPSMFKSIAKLYLNADVKVVGVSATVMRVVTEDADLPLGMSFEAFNERCAWLKSQAPNAKMVVGGAQIPYIDTADLKSITEVDYFVTGQGEEVITRILESVTQNTKVKSHDLLSPNILSDKFIPYQKFSSKIDLFQKEDAILPGEPLPMELARGCIFRCKFCSYDLTGKGVGDFTKNPSNLLTELKHNYENFGTQHYVIMDDLLNDSDEKVNLIYDIAQKLDFPISFVGYLRLDLVRRYPQNLIKLRDAGLYAGFFGIETVNDSSGKAVAKGLGLARINEGLNTVYDVFGDDFFGEAGLILGLPHDDPETKYQILEWATDPLVSRVIKKFAVQELGISTRFGHSDIDQAPGSFGYSILDQNTTGIRSGIDHWKTDKYDYIQARTDADWVMQQLVGDDELLRLMTIWNLPYFAYLYGDRPKFLDMANKKIEKEHGLLKKLYQLQYNQRKEYLLKLGQYR